ncbi:uracil-DNA glycosylase [Candidatus Pantoea carbekii]|uniref:Uracil-DNA glycosylase n=1 Tax=Candidatus Pantoea carbekii TaxID=1235990 RepID=U3U2N1_9GAMM|nr:uracil-DNA glycosylase [Candidatus Pantoea carbekii]AKC31877.1 uracil-DNA glycosylase [Candidatus Pantoea carbekii]BAO00391.1 Ung protein [Candidatus Pantoea carbekii]
MANKLTWYDVLAEEKKKSYFNKILKKISNERMKGVVIYPSQKNVFNAFRLTKLHNLKVVILGQDPYHGTNQAHGLAFSVLPGIAIPPSLSNIYKEIEQDIPSFVRPKHGCLEHWAKQGVLLLNTILTVEAGKAHSHSDFGWQRFTDQVISVINDNCRDIIFLLWGKNAQKKSDKIDHRRHYVLTAAHPSPLSAYNGFFGCKHFSQVNVLLKLYNRVPINWTPPPV